MNPWGSFRAEDADRIPVILADYSGYVEEMTNAIAVMRKRLAKGLTAILLVFCLLQLGAFLFFDWRRASHAESSSVEVHLVLFSAVFLLVLGCLLMWLIWLGIQDATKERRLLRESLEEGIGKLEELVRMASQFGAQIERGTEKLIYSDFALSKAERVLRRAQAFR